MPPVTVSAVAVTLLIVKMPVTPPPRVTCCPTAKPSLIQSLVGVVVRVMVWRPALRAFVSVPAKFGPVSVMWSPPIWTSETDPVVEAVTATVRFAAGFAVRVEPVSVSVRAVTEKTVPVVVMSPVTTTCCPATKPSAPQSPVARVIVVDVVTNVPVVTGSIAPSVSVRVSPLIAVIVRVPLTPEMSSCWPTARPAFATVPAGSTSVPPVDEPVRVSAPVTR